MITRHTYELMARLDQVADDGCTVIKTSELLRWYERDRITKNVWKDIYEKWVELETESTLLIGDGDGIVTLIFGKGLKASEDSWFADIRTWADIKNDPVE